MLVDLLVEARDAVVVGGGREAEMKVLKLIDGKANVTVIALRFTKKILGLRNRRRLKLFRAHPLSPSAERLLRRLKPRVVFVSTGRSDVDGKVAASARRTGALTCVVDRPRLNDFNMPAIAKVGDLRIGISTGGSSPAMAGVIRRRVEELIKPDDILQVRLQGELRRWARESLRDASSRRELARRVIRSRVIRKLLRENRLDEGRAVARGMLLSMAQ